MQFPRRHVLRLAASALAIPGFAGISYAQQKYPSRPVRILVGATAGGGTDIMARLIGQWLSNRLGQPFIVEDRAGAGTNLATEVVVRAAPDGHTLLLVTAANAINAGLYRNLTFNFLRDIAPVAGLIRVPLVMVINPSLPAKTVPEFIAYAKANPGKISMATGVNGGAPHVAGELFKLLTGVNMVQVPYKGLSLALSDLLAGQVQVLFSGVPAAIEFIRAGKLRGLAVTTVAREATLPDLPSLADFVPGFEASQWYGVGAPSNTPADIIETLNGEINAGLADPKIKAQLANLGGATLASTPAEFGALVAAETEKWEKVVKFSGAKAD
jgi:tripartite-type tricarboxylate transporter receptor subunit TctC